MPTEKKYIRCTSCNKVIGEIVHLNDGEIEIQCKCKTVNTIKAVPKQQESTVLGVFEIAHMSS